MKVFPPKQYRLGSEQADGRWTIQVSDRGLDNWSDHETCPTQALALARIESLNRARHAPGQTRSR